MFETKVVRLDRIDNTQLTVNLHGCTITSWRVNNWEQLFVSRHAKFNNQKEILGGVSFCFPKYGGWKFGPPNGFACITRWTLERGPYHIKDSFDVEAVFKLVDNPYTTSFWNFQFEIINVITLHELSIEIKTCICNTSPVLPMRFNLMFPIFIQVPNIETVQIVGMNRVQYRDETFAENETRVDRKRAIEISNWMYRIYKNAPHNAEVFHVTSDFSLKVENSDLDDFMVWNPWVDEAQFVDDFRPEQYKEMVCVGMGNVNREIRLLPGEKYNCSLKLEINNGKGFCKDLY